MSDAKQAAHQALDRRLDEALPILERWVTTNSYSGNVPGVNQVGALMAEDLSLPGLALERHPGEAVGDHLVWSTPAWRAAGPGARLLLVGHHDTVFPPGAFEVWEREGDLLRGPGVLDMKGGLVTVRTALAALADVGLLADVPVALVSVGDEEIGSVHSSALTRSLATDAGAALVFEAGRAEDRIITQRKGTGAVRAVAHGTAAHAGNHHADGVNAIWALARFIDRVQALTDYDRGITVNVGLVSGGEARNTVPHQAECGIDLRFVRAEHGEEVTEHMRAIACELSAEGARIEVHGGVRRLPLERTEASVALCRRYGEAAAEAGLGSEEAGLIGGGSDASNVSAVGVPAIDGLGPRGSGFHTHREVIEVSSLALRARALLTFLLGWGQGPGVARP